MALIKVNKPLELRFWIVVFSVVFIGVSNSVYSQAPTLTTPADRSVIFPTDDDPFHNVSFSWSSTGASSYKIEIVSEVGFNWGQPTVDRTFTGITDTSYNADLFIGNFYKWRITDESTGQVSPYYYFNLPMKDTSPIEQFNQELVGQVVGKYDDGSSESLKINVGSASTSKHKNISISGDGQTIAITLFAEYKTKILKLNGNNLWEVIQEFGPDLAPFKTTSEIPTLNYLVMVQNYS